MTSCGECNACCTTLAVQAIQKPMDTACLHLRSRPGESCSIYSSRPKQCADFYCVWRLGIFDSLKGLQNRPDKLGIVFTPNGECEFENTVLGHAVRPRADKEPAARATLERLAEEGIATILRDGKRGMISGDSKHPLMVALAKGEVQIKME